MTPSPPELSIAVDEELRHRHSMWFADGREPHVCDLRTMMDGRLACRICGALTEETCS